MRSGVKLIWIVLISISGLLQVAPVIAQQNGTSVQVGVAQQIPGAARVTPGGPATLSFEQAIQLAIQNNLATLLARERRNEARGVKQQSLCRASAQHFRRCLSGQLDREPGRAWIYARNCSGLQFNFRWSIQEFRRARFVRADNL